MSVGACIQQPQARVLKGRGKQIPITSWQPANNIQITSLVSALILEGLCVTGQTERSAQEYEAGMKVNE